MVEVFRANAGVADQVWRTARSAEIASGLKAFDKAGRRDAIGDRMLNFKVLPL